LVVEELDFSSTLGKFDMQTWRRMEDNVTNMEFNSKEDPFSVQVGV